MFGFQFSHLAICCSSSVIFNISSSLLVSNCKTSDSRSSLMLSRASFLSSASNIFNSASSWVVFSLSITSFCHNIVSHESIYHPIIVIVNYYNQYSLLNNIYTTLTRYHHQDCLCMCVTCMIGCYNNQDHSTLHAAGHCLTEQEHANVSVWEKSLSPIHSSPSTLIRKCPNSMLNANF